MSELKRILERYKQNGEDEQRFMDKHTDNVADHDAPGSAEIKKASNVTKKKKRTADQEGDSVYETFSMEDIRAVLVSEDIDEEVIDRIETHLIEASPEFFMNIIGDAIHQFREEATDEEKVVIDEMLSTEEGYEELIELIFEEDDDDDEDDDDEDDEDDDEVIDDKPKIKKEKKSEE